MSMLKKHAQAIADKIALDKHGIPFSNLSEQVQDKIYEQARQIAQTELEMVMEKHRNA